VDQAIKGDEMMNEEIKNPPAVQETKALVKVQNYMENEIVKSRFATVLGERGAASYIASVLLAVANNESLQKCIPQSIYISALRAATMRLSVDQSTGQAYLVPFKDKATLIVGWKGLYDMAIRTNRYRYINVGKVFEGQEFVQDQITGYATIEGNKTSRKVIGYVAAFEMFPPKGQVRGTGVVIYMSIEEIHAHKEKYSKGWTRSDSAWTTNPEAMEKKTILRKLLRTYGYIDPQDEATLNEVEDENSGNDLPVTDNNFNQEDMVDVATEPEQPPMTDEEARANLEREQRIQDELGF
jgi:recombination protein RecT